MSYVPMHSRNHADAKYVIMSRVYNQIFGFVYWYRDVMLAYSGCQRPITVFLFVVIVLQLLILFKDTQQDLLIRRVAAAATTCVCLKIHSGNPTSTEIKFCLDQSPEWNMNCLILEGIAITSSLRETTAVIHYVIIRHRVQFAMWKVTQQSS